VTPVPGFVSLYTNDTQIHTTPWDIRLIFGEIAEGPTKERPSVRIKATGEVRMWPQHAKRIVAILLKQFQQYESKYGPIPKVGDD